MVLYREKSHDFSLFFYFLRRENMAQDIKETLLDAIDTMIDSSISALKVDKTITASVISCNNAITGEYILSYNGGRITAYTEDASKSYIKNQSVYVLVPSGEISNRKVILGVAQNIGTDQNLTSTAAALDNYNLLGMSLLTAPDSGFYPKGVCSYKSTDIDILYDYNENESNAQYLSYQKENAEKNLSRAEKILIQASFKTSLSSEHRYNTNGDYGLIIGLAFKDNEHMCVKYDIEAANTNNETLEDGEDGRFTQECENLKTKLTEITVAGYTKAEDYYGQIRVAYSDFDTFCKNNLTAESYAELKEDPINFPTYSSTLQVTVDDLKDSITQALKQKVEGTIIKYCQLNSMDMIGDPYSFGTYSQQYGIFDVDVDNFSHIDCAYLICSGFEETTIADKTSDDIFIKNIKIYFLKEISSKNGDFTLKVSQPSGNTFTTTSENEKLQTLCSVTYQNNNITSSCEFFWFKKDLSITQTSADYNYRGGVGWKYMGSAENTKSYYTNGKLNRVAENTWKVTAVYNNSTSLSDTYVFYNTTADSAITIDSDLGTEFYFDKGSPTLTCKINGEQIASKARTESDKTITTNYKFTWSQIDSINGSTVFTKTYDQYAEEIQKIKDNKESNSTDWLTQKRAAQTEQAKAKNITFIGDTTNTNQIKYDTSNITSGSISLSCSVTAQDNNEGEWYDVGSATIILSNQKSEIAKDYYIIIENGAQTFQYTEAGVSPASESRGEEKIEPKSLTCTFYDPNGYEIPSTAYDLYWLIPFTDTLIEAPEGAEISTSTDLYSQNYKYTVETCPVSIAEKYSFSNENSQIQAVVEYDGKVYKQYTNFAFLKVGENGSNGTDVVVRITPAMTQGNIDAVSKGEELLALVCDTKRLHSNANGTEQNSIFQNARWNTGENLTTYKLQGTAYSGGQEIDSSLIQDISWRMAGVSKNAPISVSGGEYYTANEDSTSTSYDPSVAKISGLTAFSEVDDFNESSMIVRATFSIQQEESSTDTDAEESRKDTTYTEDTTVNSNDKTLKSYYGFYPVPCINYWKRYVNESEYNADLSTEIVSPIRVAIDKQETLRTILYDASGENPQYNSNQGIRLKIYANKNSEIYNSISAEDYLKNLTITFSAVGGSGYTGALSSEAYLTSAFGVYDSNSSTDTNQPLTVTGQSLESCVTTIDGVTMIDIKKFIIPNETYTGQYLNNYIVVEISQPVDFTANDNINADDVVEVCKVYLPIHLSLNTHSLASLNAWDGNTIETNEEDGYILAPQIGAGYKEEVTSNDGSNNTTNVFTGVVMGTRVTHDEKNNEKKEAGLFGYYRGAQSVDISAEDGSVTLGLAEDAASEQNGWNEGRIQMVPGGESYIANWHIGSKTLYSVFHNEDGSTEKKPALSEDVPNEMQIQYNMTDEVYDRVIDPRDKGILLSSDPAWFSVKGAPLVETDSRYMPIDFDHGNTQVKPGDSLEVAIDPNQKSIFTLYQHSTVYSSTQQEGDTPEIQTLPLVSFGNDNSWRDTQIGWSSKDKKWTLADLIAVDSTTKKESPELNLLKNGRIDDDDNTGVNTRVAIGIIHKKSAVADNGYYNKDDIYTITFAPWIENTESANWLTNDNITTYTFEKSKNTTTEYNLDNMGYIFINPTVSTSKFKNKNNYYIATMRTVKISGISQRVNESTNLLKLVRSSNSKNVAAGTIFDEYNYVIRECNVALENKLYNQSELNKNDAMVWTKTPRVGIDANGRFYTNALKDQSTALNMGKLSAFSHSIANDARYIGTSFELGESQDTASYSYLKVMVPKANNTQDDQYLDPDNPVILSSGSTADMSNEYDRPMEMYAKDFKLYVGDDKRYAAKRFNVGGLTLSSDSAHFGINQSDDRNDKDYYGTNYDKVANYDRIYQGVDSKGEKKNTQSLTYRGAYFDLFRDTTSQTINYSSSSFPKKNFDYPNPNGYTTTISSYDDDGDGENPDNKKIKLKNRSGLCLTDSPFKLWNFKAGTGIYTNNFFQYVGATASTSTLEDDTTGWSEDHVAIWADFGAGAKVPINNNEKYVLTNGASHLWTKSNFDLRTIGLNPSAITLSQYEKEEKKNTSTPKRGLLIGLNNELKEKEVTYSNSETPAGSSFILGDYVAHDNRIDTLTQEKEECQYPMKDFSLLELRNGVHSYLYANRGLTIHSGSISNAAIHDKTNHTGDASGEYQKLTNWGEVTSGGINLISDQGGILLEARNNSNKTKGSLSAASSSSPTNYIWLNSGHNYRAQIKSWSIGGFGGIIEDQHSGILNGICWDNDVEGDKGVHITPGIKTNWGVFTKPLSSNAVTWTDENGIVHSKMGGSKSINIVNDTDYYGNYSIYAKNGLVTEGYITSAQEIWAKGDVHARNGGNGEVTLCNHVHIVSGWQNFTVTAAGTDISGASVAANVSVDADIGTDSSTENAILDNIYLKYMHDSDDTGIEGSAPLLDYIRHSTTSYKDTTVTGWDVNMDNMKTDLKEHINIHKTGFGISVPAKTSTFEVSTEGYTSSADGVTHPSSIDLSMTSTNDDFSIRKD